MFNLVCFMSEGPPNDNGLNLSANRNILLRNTSNHFDNIEIYTPKILRDMGLGQYVKEHEKLGLVHRNPGMNKIGFCAWRPKIMLLELEKMNDGDILIYRDSNIKKSGPLGIYDDIKNRALDILKEIDFDFFVPRESKSVSLKQHTKNNVIKELGEDHPFVYDFPNLYSGLLVIIKKSKVSMELLHEWENACLNDEWIDGNIYTKHHAGFKWSCPEQSILGVIIANWVRKRKHNIPLKYPLIGFENRNICKKFFYDEETDYEYLKKI